MTDLEEMLRSTLGHAAERAPRLSGSLAAHVATRHRRRRRSRAALAAAAMAVVTGGTTAVLLGQAPAVGNPQATQSAAVATPTRTEHPLPDPVEKVWPQAVRKIPVRLPDGIKFQPEAFIDDRTLLVTTSVSFEKAGALLAYDLETRQARKLAEVPTPEGTVLFASDFTIGDGHIVWWTASKGGTAQLWAVPVTGGQAKRVAELKGADDAALDPPAVADGRIAVSFRGGGVFTVPLEGGTPEPVPDAEKLHILKWPWIGEGNWYGPHEGTQFGDIRNVETGETRTAVTRPGERDVQCGVTSCTGSRDDGTSFVRMRDGSQERELPGGALTEGLARERFRTAPAGDAKALGMVLYDLATGTAADLGIRAGKDHSMFYPVPARDERLLSYPVRGGIAVIDLSKIT